LTIKIKELEEVRCIECNKKLGELKGKAAIKCPKCGTLNQFQIK
jgi:phage FluMu protein Com